MLESSREQLSRVSSRLAQTAGLTSLDLAAEVVAFSYGAIGAAVEVALNEAMKDVLPRLRVPAPHALTDEQLAAAAEASFVGFTDGERMRGQYDVKKAVDLRAALIRSLRGHSSLAPTESVVTMSGVPDLAHIWMFFTITTNGDDPRGPLAVPPLSRLVGRVNQIRGPRNDFAHECSDPTEHELVVGRTRDAAGLASEVAKLQAAVADLEELVDVFESACTQLARAVSGLPPAVELRWWQAASRRLVGRFVGRPR